MFSNHHEIMLILIFTSKLPREWEELLLKKKSYHMSIPINVKHLPFASRRSDARRGDMEWGRGVPLHLWLLEHALHRDALQTHLRTHCLRLYLLLKELYFFWEGFWQVHQREQRAGQDFGKHHHSGIRQVPCCNRRGSVGGRCHQGTGQ